MQAGLLTLFFFCSLTRVASLKLEVCLGGACTRNGGALLLDAAAALGCSDDSLEVKAASCMSKCPNRDVVLRGADGAMRTVSASGLDGALDAAAEWLEHSGVPTTAAVREGFAAKVEGEEALRSGEAQRAVERFDAALAAAPAAIASMVAHAPPEDEPLVWDESEWQQQALGGGGVLTFAESCFTYEYAACGGAVLTNCALLDEETARLGGQYESDEGEGDFEVEMSPDGRSFRGTLTAADGEEREWTGTRVTRASGEEPPSRVRWVFDALVGRGRAHLALQQAEAAREDAQAATRLCCLTASGWLLLADAAEACGDAEAAEAARGEAVQLIGSSR